MPEQLPSTVSHANSCIPKQHLKQSPHKTLNEGKKIEEGIRN